jgi:hypothetical protein
MNEKTVKNERKRLVLGSGVFMLVAFLRKTPWGLKRPEWQPGVRQSESEGRLYM